MLMVAMIGPIEFSANTLNKNARDATVVNATAAYPNAAMYLQKYRLVTFDECWLSEK